MKVTKGSGNVFKDLGLKNHKQLAQAADKEIAKMKLAKKKGGKKG